MQGGEYTNQLLIKRNRVVLSVKIRVLLRSAHIKKPESLYLVVFHGIRNLNIPFNRFVILNSVIFAHLFRETLLIP